MRFHQRFPELYEKTGRISLVSSFLCSLFLGRIAPIDISDVCGMNLWDMRSNSWSQELLDLSAPGLRSRLGSVETQPGKHLGLVSPYFVERYGLSKGELFSRVIFYDAVLVMGNGRVCNNSVYW